MVWGKFYTNGHVPNFTSEICNQEDENKYGSFEPVPRPRGDVWKEGEFVASLPPDNIFYHPHSNTVAVDATPPDRQHRRWQAIRDKVKRLAHGVGTWCRWPYT